MSIYSFFYFFLKGAAFQKNLKKDLQNIFNSMYTILYIFLVISSKTEIFGSFGIMKQSIVKITSHWKNCGPVAECVNRRITTRCIMDVNLR